MRQRIAVGLILLSYFLLVTTAVRSRALGDHSAHAAAPTDAAYGHPWTIGLTVALAVAGIALALVPVRREEAWARWTVLATLVAIGLPRLLTDPRCFVVIDPHQHDCHRFALLLVSGVLGVILARAPVHSK